MVSESRSDRIADRIKRELTLLFLKEISDPRLEGVNITYVDVDRELAFADIYVSAVEGEDRKGEVMGALKRATGFVRSQLVLTIAHLRTFPQIRFHWDPVPGRVERLDQIFAELDQEEGLDEQDE